jgi:hypothetical protein
MKLSPIALFTLLIFFFGCEQKQSAPTETLPTVTEPSPVPISKASDKIAILNFGTFHFGLTNDANTTEFDEHDQNNQAQAHQIAEKLSAFKPTVILVEHTPENNEKLNKQYQDYLKNPAMPFENPSEVELLAFEVGRLAGVQRMYGIDHQMAYNYNIGNEIENAIDSVWHNQYYKDPFIFYPEVEPDQSKLSLFEKLKQTNHNQYLDFLMAVNADMLTHAGTPAGFEGADEAAKFYQRNLRMYSNLNRIELAKTDRVFILMGASHTAFFRDFIGRSPKYEMVNTFDYLK